MRDYNSAVEKLRSDAAEAELIRDVVAVEAKREMFGRLAQHLHQLANEVEHAHERGKGQLTPSHWRPLSWRGEKRQPATRGKPKPARVCMIGQFAET